MFIKGKFLINLILFFIYMKIWNEICIVLGMYLSSERILLVCEYSGDFVYLLELKDMLFLFVFLYWFFFGRSNGDMDIVYVVEWKFVYVYFCVLDM